MDSLSKFQRLLEKNLKEIGIRHELPKVRIKRRIAFKLLRSKSDVKIKPKKWRRRSKNKRKHQPKYREYIKSKEWKKKRRAFIELHGRKCAACDSKNKLRVHHMSYRHLGNERENELIILCARCHEEYHELNGVQQNMIEKTLRFVEEKRAELAFRGEFRDQADHLKFIRIK